MVIETLLNGKMFGYRTSIIIKNIIIVQYFKRIIEFVLHMYLQKFKYFFINIL